MRFAQPLEQGRLVRRYKRFLADIVTDEGEALCIHCPNTGSMLNCMSEGARVWFQRSSDPRRKLPGTWELVETPQGRLAQTLAPRGTRAMAAASESDGCSMRARVIWVRVEGPSCRAGGKW